MIPLLPLDIPDGCNCCTSPALLEWHRLARVLDPVFACEVQKEDEVTQESGGEAFLDEELAITAALSAAWGIFAPPATRALQGAVSAGYSPSHFQSVLDEISPEAGRIFDHAEPAVRQAVRSVVRGGAAAIDTADALVGLPSAAVFENSIIIATRYTSNFYFNNQIVPSIIRAIDAFYDQTDAPSISDIQAMIARHFKTVPYWGLVANVAASRGFHYGMLRTMQLRGILGYRLVAVLDSRTSQICRVLNGREFLVSEAVNVLDALAEDPDPMAARTRTPWLKADEVRGRSSADLAALGVMIPPLHPFCRTTLQPIY